MTEEYCECKGVIMLTKDGCKRCGKPIRGIRRYKAGVESSENGNVEGK